MAADKLQFRFDRSTLQSGWFYQDQPIKIITLADLPSLDQRDSRSIELFFKHFSPEQVAKLAAEDYQEKAGYVYGYGLISNTLTEDGKAIVDVINPFIMSSLGALTSIGIDFEGEATEAHIKDFDLDLGNGKRGKSGLENHYLLIQGNTRKIAIEKIAGILKGALKDYNKALQSSTDPNSDTVQKAREALDLAEVVFNDISVEFLPDEDLALSVLNYYQNSVNNTVTPHAFSNRKPALEYWNSLVATGLSRGEADTRTAEKFMVSVGTIQQWKALASFPPIVLNFVDAGILSAPAATKFHTFYNKLEAQGLIPEPQTEANILKNAVAHYTEVFNLTGKGKEKSLSITPKQLEKYVTDQQWYQQALTAKQEQEAQEDGLDEDETYLGYDSDAAAEAAESNGDATVQYTLQDMRDNLPDMLYRLHHLTYDTALTDLALALVGSEELTIKDGNVKSLFAAVKKLLSILDNDKLVTKVEPKTEEAKELSPV